MSILYKVKSRGLPLIGISVIYTAFGLALIFQPLRWSRTPAYGILLSIFKPEVWGTVYLIVAAIILTSILSQSRSLIVMAHTLAVALSTGWLAAFTVRYLTDSATTIVNVVSWSTFTGILLYSVAQIDKKLVVVEVPLVGPTGHAGLPGAKGERGNQGNQGPEGARGLTGDPGRTN